MNVFVMTVLFLLSMFVVSMIDNRLVLAITTILLSVGMSSIALYIVSRR